MRYYLWRVTFEKFVNAGSGYYSVGVETGYFATHTRNVDEIEKVSKGVQQYIIVKTAEILGSCTVLEGRNNA